MLRTPPFPSRFFTENRRELSASFDADAVILLQSADSMVRNSDMEHPWRQDSSFFYLTGIDEPGCSLLILPNKAGTTEEILFIPSVDPEKEKWNGKMLTRDDAKLASGIEKVQYSETLMMTLFRSQKWRDVLYVELNDFFPDQPLTRQHRILGDISRRLPGLQIRKLDPHTARLRHRKKPEEVANIRTSLHIINDALSAVMRKLKPGMMEYQVEAEIVYHYLNNGCNRVGFEAIVAGGENAAILHYVTNHARLNDGDMVLIDTGGEYGMYSGDITRVYPVNGRFTPRQRQCYQAVLDVNQAFIEALSPGDSWKQLYEKAGEIIGEIYHRAGFIDDPRNHLAVSYHRIGHYLGLDVHDVGRLDWPMAPGTIITVEPGLYLPDEKIGVRIEDNILFTEQGIEILSRDIPKEIEEIESMMAAAS
ncbi:aminopeptidase P N-terminal domain-containing protein [bacterium]|nr:aminopeptidase P N-terminal domain-containing protein [bacterium]